MLGNTVFTVFMLARGLNYAHIGIIESIFAIACMLEIFGGAFADLIGRRVAVLLQGITVGIASILFGISHTFWMFLLANITWGVGLAIGAGADNALLYDSLKNVGREKEFIKIYGTARFYRLASGMLGSLIGAYLYTIQETLPFIFSAVFYIASGIVYYFAHETPPTTRYSIFAHYTTIKKGLHYTATNKHVRWITILGILATTYFAYFGVIQSPYLLERNFTITNIGWIIAIVMAIEAVFAYNTERIHQKFSEQTCFALIIGLQAISSIGLALAFGKHAITFLILQRFSSGFGITFSEHYLQKHAPSTIRATIASAEGFILDLTMAITIPFFSYLTDVHSIDYTLLIIGIGIAIAGSALLLLFPKHTHKTFIY